MISICQCRSRHPLFDQAYQQAQDTNCCTKQASNGRDPKPEDLAAVFLFLADSRLNFEDASFSEKCCFVIVVIPLHGAVHLRFIAARHWNVQFRSSTAQVASNDHSEPVFSGLYGPPVSGAEHARGSIVLIRCCCVLQLENPPRMVIYLLFFRSTYAHLIQNVADIAESHNLSQGDKKNKYAIYVSCEDA